MFPKAEITNVTFMQEEDTSGRLDFELQTLNVEFIDSGSGYYVVLQTERWAIDRNEKFLVDLRAFCDGVMVHNDELLNKKNTQVEPE